MLIQETVRSKCKLVGDSITIRKDMAINIFQNSFSSKLISA